MKLVFAQELNKQLEVLAQQNGPLTEIVKAFQQKYAVYNQLLTTNIEDTQAYGIVKRLLNELKAKIMVCTNPTLRKSCQDVIQKIENLLPTQLTHKELQAHIREMIIVQEKMIDAAVIISRLDQKFPGRYNTAEAVNTPTPKGGGL